MESEIVYKNGKTEKVPYNHFFTHNNCYVIKEDESNRYIPHHTVLYVKEKTADVSTPYKKVRVLFETSEAIFIENVISVTPVTTKEFYICTNPNENEDAIMWRFPMCNVNELKEMDV